MKKALIVSTVSRQFTLFERGNIEVLKELAYEIHGVANYEDKNLELDQLGIKQHHIDIQRNPFKLANLKAYRQLAKLMKEEKFDLVHCHAPMGGVIGRLAAKSVGIKNVLYTAHGFHFYNGASYINWLIYYNVEKFLSKYTDTIITINNEDYARAKEFKAKNVLLVPGIGVDLKKFRNTKSDIEKKRKELNISDEVVALLSIGEMIKRKNYETTFKALSMLKNNNYIFLVCGRGKMEKYLKELVKTLNIEEKVRFLGYRNDIPEICMACDIFIFPSYQEGLPVAVMESMAAGLPIIGSKIRGNIDLIQNGCGGYLHEPTDYVGIAKSIDIVIENKELRNEMKSYNKAEVMKYDKEIVKKKMRSLYERF